MALNDMSERNTRHGIDPVIYLVATITVNDVTRM